MAIEKLLADFVTDFPDQAKADRFKAAAVGHDALDNAYQLGRADALAEMDEKFGNISDALVSNMLDVRFVIEECRTTAREEFVAALEVLFAKVLPQLKTEVLASSLIAFFDGKFADPDEGKFLIELHPSDRDAVLHLLSSQEDRALLVENNEQLSKGEAVMRFRRDRRVFDADFLVSELSQAITGLAASSGARYG